MDPVPYGISTRSCSLELHQRGESKQVKEILKDNPEIEVRKNPLKEFKVRTHKIRLDYVKEEIKLDIEERFKTELVKIELIPYKKFSDKGFAVVTVGKELFQKFQQVRTIRIDYKNKRVNTEVYVPRCQC